MEFETIEPNVWKVEKEGDCVEGVLLRKQEKVGVNESMLYNLEKDGSLIGVWGSTVLDDRMSFVAVGDYVRITFKGVQKNKKNQDVKIFKVEKGKVEKVADTSVSEV